MTEPLLFPVEGESRMRPPAVYERLRRTSPVCPIVLPDGSRGYFVTRHEDVRTVLQDPRFSRKALSKASAGEVVAVAPSEVMATADDEDHSVPHTVANRAFSPRAMAALRARAHQVVNGLLDDMEAAGPPADLIAALAHPFPMTVIGELLGIPVEDRPWLRERASLTVVAVPSDESRGAVKELSGYLRELLEVKRRDGAGDVLGTLVTAWQEHPEQLREDKLALLAMRVCVAGLHSVDMALAKGVPILLRQPDVYAAIAREPGLVADVVEELVRIVNVAPSAMPRLAVTDVELSGTLIPAGSVVIACLESANLDEERYPEPETIVPGRADQRHVGFGLGHNFCLGAALARMELGVAIGSLARRLPTLRLAVAENALRFRYAAAIGPEMLELPVTW